MPSGPPVQYYPLDPALMARTCRKLAADMRREAAAGFPDIVMRSHTNQYAGPLLISRIEAARRMDLQAKRWEEEVRTGVPNVIDRSKIGW